jgi:hypothetical protein
MANAFLQFILTKKCPPFIMYYASGRSLTPEGIFIPEGKSVPFWLFCYCSESLNIDRCSSNACIRKNIWQYLFDEVISMSKNKASERLFANGDSEQLYLIRRFSMKKLTVLNKSILTALCVALCVVLPMTLHAIPKGGVLFSPMHLPVLLCGLVCGAPFGLVCGILGPLVSSLLTGMPVFGYMPVMMIELGLYGLISGLVMQFLRSGKLVVDLYAALVIAMLGGRVITGILRALIFAGGSYSWSAWATGYFVSCLPGIIIQLILIPIIYVALERAHLLPVRYPAVSVSAETEAA